MYEDRWSRVGRKSILNEYGFRVKCHEMRRKREEREGTSASSFFSFIISLSLLPFLSLLADPDSRDQENFEYEENLCQRRKRYGRWRKWEAKRRLNSSSFHETNVNIKTNTQTLYFNEGKGKLTKKQRKTDRQPVRHDTRNETSCSCTLFPP